MRTLKAGGDTVHTVVDATNPTDIVIDSTYVYFLEPGSVDIMRAPKVGASSATIFASPPMLSTFQFMVSDGVAIYATGSTGAIGEYAWRIDLATGTQTQLTGIGELHGGSGAQAVGAALYGATSLAGPVGQIVWIDKTGGGGGSINTGMFVPSSLAVASCGFVWGVPTVGLNLSVLGFAFPANLDATATPNAVVVDSNVVYWTDASGAVGQLRLP